MDPAVDAEVMEVARHLVTDLGFRDLSFQINSTGCPKCRPTYVASLVEYYAEHADQVCDDCKRRLELNPLRVLDCKNKTCQPLIQGAPHFVDFLCDECSEHFQTLQHYLNVLGRTFSINHRLVRGLDYYTKTVFEVWSKDIGAQSAVFGGGRYDGLMELLGGPSMPGIGFGSGIERLILAMKAQGIQVPALPQPQVLIASLGSQAKSAGVSLLADLRAAQVPAVIAFGDRSLRSQMREAGRQNARFALILGDQEVERGQVSIRDMQSREQTDLPTTELIAWLQERL
jgi:histidyl-tRNA synthetase